MKNISKLLLSSALCTSLAYGVSFEYPQIYKDQKTMGMGGASVASGGTAASLFSNPAGLSKLRKSDGWEINVIDFTLASNDNIKNFAEDLDDIPDNLTEDQESQEVLKILEKYLGDNLHISTNFSAINVSKHFDKYAFSFMPISGVYANLIPHRGNGTDGLLEANGIGYGGLALGISRKLDYTGLGLTNLNVGLGIKALKYQAFNHKLTVAEIVDHKDDMGDYLLDDLSEEGTSVVADLGFQAQAFENVDLGLSVMNIGSVGAKDKFEIPMTVNAGLAYTINREDSVFLDKFVLAADYIDIFQAYEQDGDILKGTRLGVNAHLMSGWLGSLSIQGGLYQGYPTYGADLRLSVLKIAYTSYAEEIGPESGDYEDRRHMLSVSLGW